MPLTPAPRRRMAAIRTILAASFLVFPSSDAQGPPQRFPSPHGKYVIEAEVRDPGGAGAPQTIVSLHKSRNKVATYQDNILVVDGDHHIAVKWEPGAQAVTVVCEGCNIERAVLAVTQFDDIGITYLTHAPEPKGVPAASKPTAK